MCFKLKIRSLLISTICLCRLLSAEIAHAVMDSRFELDPAILSGSKTNTKPQKVAVKRAVRTGHGKSLPKTAKERFYTVKSGDNLSEMIMRDYSLSSSEAEMYIEEIKRENNIYDIKKIKAGRRIVLPPILRNSDGSQKKSRYAGMVNGDNASSGSTPEQSFKLESPAPVISEQQIVAKAHDTWSRIVPSKNEQLKPLSFQTPTFSLALDPVRYPVFARMDGGRIILDQNGSIPPLVKSLIENKDASIKIVSEVPSGSKHFMASLLGAAGFYSVEEDFGMEFGIDPKLTVQADFKVEKTSESLIKQDLVLVNSGRMSLPASLGEFLKKEGFTLYEPFASSKSFAQRDSRTVHYVSSTKQPEMIDSILSALSVSTERDRPVDVFAADNNGISLSVKAERYFERGGKRCVVTSFDGDPINYTLFRILETKGYNVAIIEAADDFRKISEKLISQLKINGSFDKHNLLQDVAAGYSLHMSGFKLDDKMLPGGGIFLTDRPMDRIIKDLFTENGFNINSL